MQNVRIVWPEATWSKPPDWPLDIGGRGSIHHGELLGVLHRAVEWHRYVRLVPTMDPPGPDTGPYRTHAADDGRPAAVAAKPSDVVVSGCAWDLMRLLQGVLATLAPGSTLLQVLEELRDRIGGPFLAGGHLIGRRDQQPS